MSRWAYAFVAVIFILLGASFVYSTYSAYSEFRDSNWQLILIAHSHIFLFFPILGLLALAAFYIPAVAFTDLYWRHIRFGPVRFILGALIMFYAANYLAERMSVEQLRTIWEVSPKELARDEHTQPLCSDGSVPCLRKPLMSTLERLREEGRKRSSLTPYARNCQPDEFLERPETDDALRYCFPAGTMLATDDCCRVQREFAEAARSRWLDPATRSYTSDFEALMLRTKIFFIIILVVIGAFLAFWRKKLNEYYFTHIPAIERGVVIGAIAMLFWPLMDYGYQQTSDVLFGRNGAGLAFRYSLVIVPWAVLLMFYFMERLGKDLERTARLSTIAASTVAILRYQEINDTAMRFFGAAAEWWYIGALAFLAVLGFALLVWPWRGTKHAFDFKKPVRRRQREHQRDLT
jgi:hypothetical protein